MSEYVSINQVAEHFNVSTSTVRSWLADKLLPKDGYIKVGRTYRFRLSVIETHLLNMEDKNDPDSDSSMDLDFGPEAA